MFIYLYGFDQYLTAFAALSECFSDCFTPHVLTDCISALSLLQVRSAMTGVPEVGLKAFYAADFDVYFATKELRLTLLPVVS